MSAAVTPAQPATVLLGTATAGDTAAWSVERRHLIEATDDRLVVGRSSSAESSLVAAPAVRRMLVDRGSSLRDETNESLEGDALVRDTPSVPSDLELLAEGASR